MGATRHTLKKICSQLKMKNKMTVMMVMIVKMTRKKRNQQGLITGLYIQSCLLSVTELQTMPADTEMIKKGKYLRIF